MTKGLAIFVLLACATSARAGILTDISCSYYRYLFCTTEDEDSKCFKLYLDPLGVTQGRIHVFIEVPTPTSGAPRFGLNPLATTSILPTHPQYNASLLGVNVFPVAGSRTRYEATVHFNSVNPINPPSGFVEIFGLETVDNRPELGLTGMQLGFQFQPGDFMSIYDTVSMTTTTVTAPNLALQGVSFNYFSADYSGNGKVDGGDVMVWQQHLGEGPDEMISQFDGDGDGDFDVDAFDLAVWRGQVSPPLTLDVNTVTGSVRIRNGTASTAAINYYEITSASGGLRPMNWVSIDDGEGDPPGVGWDEAGGASTMVLAESNHTGFLTLGATQSQPLGSLYNVLAAEDLHFRYVRSDGGLVEGAINYNQVTPVEGVSEPSGVALAVAALAFLGRAGNRRRRVSMPRGTPRRERTALASRRNRKMCAPLRSRASR